MTNADFSIYRSWKSWDEDRFYFLPDEDRVYFTKELERCGIAAGRRLSVFEIGFGNANFAKYCHVRGHSYAGSELDPELVARARDMKIEAFDSSRPISEAAGGRLFDLVAAFDVFEHIDCGDLIEMLNDARKILSLGGRIVARFPNGDSPLSAPFFNGDMTHRTLIGIGKLDQICRFSGLRIAGYHAQSIAVRGLGFANALGKVPVIAGRRLVEAALSNLYYGRQKLVFAPNMVAVLEAEPDTDDAAGGKDNNQAAEGAV